MPDGDWLLFANNAVLGIMFVPTLLRSDTRVHPLTAAVYVVMIAIGAAGYFLNGQYLPGIPTAIGSVLWAVMLWKSTRKAQAPTAGGRPRPDGDGGAAGC